MITKIFAVYMNVKIVSNYSLFYSPFNSLFYSHFNFLFNFPFNFPFNSLFYSHFNFLFNFPFNSPFNFLFNFHFNFHFNFPFNFPFNFHFNFPFNFHLNKPLHLQGLHQAFRHEDIVVLRVANICKDLGECLFIVLGDETLALFQTLLISIDTVDVGR